MKPFFPSHHEQLHWPHYALVIAAVSVFVIINAAARGSEVYETTTTTLLSDQPTGDQTTELAARRRHHRKTIGIDSNGNPQIVTRSCAGFTIKVHAAVAHKFCGLLNDLVASGHRPKFVTCYARGHKPGSNHAWGGACDIDQTAWGKTSRFMYHATALIKANGLYDGCSFRDCGHVEAMRGLHNKPPNIYEAVAAFKNATTN